jgi:glycosyltransferase involved in cell wall biosynthesis
MTIISDKIQMLPFVSIIIPSFNEEKFIGGVLDNIVEQDYPHERLEVFLIDGNSRDKTRDLILLKAKEHPFIHLLINEKQYVPFALNLGISRAKGEVIVIMGSHSLYPSNYVSSLVEALFKLDADNVGGVLINNTTSTSLKPTAIANVLSSLFGIGNAYFRIGSKHIKRVDTVPFGCYHRSVFDRIGLFDEELFKNQDDEFNARLIQKGGSIYLIPEIKIIYFTRESVKALWRMFFQYGFFKPLVNLKLKQPANIRQFFPPVFVVFLFLTLTGSFFSPWIFYSLIAGGSIYILANLFFTLKIMLETRRPLLLFFLPWLFLVLHLAYGWGYLIGIVKFVFFNTAVQNNF